MVMNSLSSWLFFRKSLSWCHFWRTVSPSIEFLVDSFGFFFFQYFEPVNPFCPDLKCLWWEICQQPYGIFLTCNFSLTAFKIRCLWLLTTMCISMQSYSSLSYLGSLAFMDVDLYFFSQFWDVFRHYCLNTLYATFSFLSGISIMQILFLSMCHTSSQALSLK